MISKYKQYNCPYTCMDMFESAMDLSNSFFFTMLLGARMPIAKDDGNAAGKNKSKTANQEIPAATDHQNESTVSKTIQDTSHCALKCFHSHVSMYCALHPFFFQSNDLGAF